MEEKSFKITNKNGLHAKLATELVQIANNYKSDISIIVKNLTINFKSIMSVMALGLTYQDSFTLKITGDDEEDCLKQLSLHILESNLGREA